MTRGQIEQARADGSGVPGAEASPASGARLQGIIDALDALRLAAVLLDRTGRAIHVSARARGLFGRDLDVARGQLTVPDDQRATAAVHAHIAAATWHAARSDGPGPRPVTIERAERRPLILTARPICGPALGRLDDVRAIVTIDDLDETAPLATDILQRLYGLTAREVDVCEALLSGRSVAESAAALGMGLSTARTHLKHVLCKTRTTRQSALLTLLNQHRCG